MPTLLDDRELYEQYPVTYGVAHSSGISDPKAFRPLGDQTPLNAILAMVLAVEDAHTGQHRPWPEVKTTIEEQLKRGGFGE